ncbi:MAG TPA: S53 family peptidase [Pseudonocardiaceae bacterium]|nr:S53 family peptidase [Pseudonocardiaceae bacterium]
MFRRTIMRGVTCAVAASAVLGMAGAVSADAQDANARAQLADTAPAWLGHAKHTGTPNANTAVNARVYLAPNGGLAKLKAAVAVVSTPGDRDYRHFITPAQYDALYEPSNATVSSVSSWLSSTGLKVTGVEGQHRYVDVTGTVANAQKAFGVSIQRYSHDGQNVQSPSGAITVPAALAGAVLSVTGLDTSQHVNTTTSTPIPPPAAFNNARPCSAAYGQLSATYEGDYKTKLPKFQGKTLSYAPCGYTGPQFRAAYEGNTNLTGKGVTVATTLWYASTTIAQDAATYAANHGDAGYAPGQLTQAKYPKFNVTPACAPSGSFSEEALDIEAVHAMAPDAKIRFYAAADCYDTSLIDNEARIVDENKVQVVTNSWGGASAGESAGSIAAYEQVFMQGALQGISFMFSSGDSGDELAATGLKQTDYPTSDQYVTSVGGTTTAIDGNGSLAWETGWGTDKYSLSADGKSWSPVGYLYGAGGGYSSLSDRPAYQNGVVPATAPPGRAVPDVSMDADPTTGMLIGLTQTFSDGVHYGEFREGGTSLASPLFAGMTALALQNAGGSVGLLNPVIYGQAKSGNFTDVKGTPVDAGAVRPDYANTVDPSGGVLYSVRTFDQDASLNTATGWDDVTGIGTPNAGYLTSLKAQKK